MRSLGLLILLSAATASARPFDRTTSYQSCTQTTMFACNMRDDAGHIFGTAKAMTTCTRYTFQPNGTFTTAADLLTQRGRYSIKGNTVTLTILPDDPAEKPTTFDLALSADGEKLGTMTRKLQ